jgi:hypothetical protein
MGISDDGAVTESRGLDPASSSAAAWTRRRLETRRWLAIHAEPLEPLFAAAVEIAENPDFPGRVYLLAHCMRELCNRLPNYYPGAAVAESSKQVQYAQRFDQLLPIWEAAGLPHDGTVPRTAGKATEDDGDRVELPIEIVRRISELVSEHVEGRIRAQHAAEQLFAAPADGRVRQPEDLEEMFNVLEIALASLLGSAAEAMDELDELLVEANI